MTSSTQIDTHISLTFSFLFSDHELLTNSNFTVASIRKPKIDSRKNKKLTLIT